MAKMEGTVRTIETSAAPETVFAIAADIERYPDWASAVKEVEVIEEDDEGRPHRARMVVEAMVNLLQ